MRALVIGGTRFIGPYVVRQLHEQGHQVTVFHRGRSQADLPESVAYIHGDRSHLSDFREEFRSLAPDVVIDMAPYFERHASMVMNTFRGISKRVVAISSCDVYQAFARLNRMVDDPAQQGNITEDSPLRTNFYPYRGMREGMDEYDKILVERTVMGDAELPGTVLRLPMVYGPGDYQHRMYSYLKRMLDGRPAILLEAGLDDWRWTRGYVEDVAAAIVLAATDERAAGQIYNVGEPEALTMKEWIGEIARAVGWSGSVVTLPVEQLPAHLKLDINVDQHIVIDTAKIRQELGFKERVQLAEATRRTVRWEERNPMENIAPEMFDYAVEDELLAGMPRL